MLPGEHLRVRHTASIFPPSTISNRHREPSPCTSEKAGQLASLFETGGSTALSQQPSKQPVPSPGLQSWQRTRFTNSCASTGFSTPEARGTGNPAISNSASYPGHGWARKRAKQQLRHRPSWGLPGGVQLTGGLRRIAQGGHAQVVFPHGNTSSPSAQPPSLNFLATPLQSTAVLHLEIKAFYVGQFGSSTT